MKLLSRVAMTGKIGWIMNSSISPAIHIEDRDSLHRISPGWIGKCGLRRWEPMKSIRGSCSSVDVCCKTRATHLPCWKPIHFLRDHQSTFARLDSNIILPIPRRGERPANGGGANSKTHTYP